jgi:AcrR family transcriptional regulator
MSMGRPKTIETEALLRIAREIFLANGAFGSTKEIAARAGVSEAALFKRFPTKAGLFAAALAPPAPDIDAILAPARREKDPRRAVHVLTHSILAHYRTAMPRMLHLITHPAVGIGALHGRLGHDAPVQLDVAIADFLREQHSKNHIHAPNIHATASLMVAALHSVVLFELMGVHGGAVPDTQVAAMIDVMWSGIKPQPKRQARRKR